MDFCLFGKHDDGLAHPTICHLLDVAAVARSVWNRYTHVEKKYLAKQLNLTISEAETFILCFSALHDIGKITPAFIHRLNIDGYKELLEKKGYSTVDYWKPFHTVASYHILNRICPDLEHLWTHLGSHHGCFLSDMEVKKPRRPGEKKLFCDGLGNEKWEKQQDELYKFIVKLFDSETVMEKVSFRNDTIGYLFLGLVSVSDWIASDVNNFPYVCTTKNADVNINEYWESIQLLAKEAVDKSWGNFNEFSEKSFGELFFDDNGMSYVPNLSQQTAIDYTRDIAEPSIVILRDSTGNGKTETMDFVANRISSVCNHRSIKYLLPTQATSDSMWKRFCEFVNNFSQNEIIDTQLVHSGTRFSGVRLNPDIYNKICITDFMRRSKCRLMSQYTIGTIDQALLGFITTRYFYMRIFAMFNSVLIIDEIQSYDVFTEQIVFSLVRHASNLRCSVIVGTATLSTKLCKKLTKAYCGIECDSDYPGIIVANDKTQKSTSLPILRQREVFINVKYESNLSRIVKNEWKKLGDNGKGALVCNTVKQSRNCYKIAKKLNYNVILIHGKFSRKIKSKLIQRILYLFGKNSEQQKILCIGTQIIEQSIDVDFDRQSSFLCPIDNLFQRSGRLQRHNKVRPKGLEKPMVTVYVVGDPTKDEFADTLIYDKHILKKSLVVLSNNRSLQFPQDVQSNIDEVYDVVSKDVDYRKRIKKDTEKKRKVDRILVDNAIVGGVRKGPISPGDVVLPSTRDITSSIVVVPCVYMDEKKIVFVDGNEAEITDVKTIYDNSVSITNRPQLAAYFSTIEVEQWEEDSTLRNMKPLMLRDGVKILGSGVIRYDEEHGLELP